MTPLLSILICSIPSRFVRAIKLYNEILAMCEGLEIEVLLLTDNKKRTIGEKREAIKNISNGKYFMFVDDDDSLYSVKEIYEACRNGVDVITFKSKCRNADGSEFIVTFGVGNEIEHNTKDGNYLDCNRPPFSQCAWSEKWKDIEYPAISYGEDGEWLQRLLLSNSRMVAIHPGNSLTEIHIPKILHGYNFDPAVSEASTETNPHWKNPNQAEIKRCVVNLSTGQFRMGQSRLSGRMGLQYYPLILFGSESEVFAPPHSDNPYAFKIYAIEAARQMGYNQILWLDASVYPVKDITPVFDYLTDKGIFLEEAGHYAGSWAPDYVLKYFGITKDEAMKMPMFSAGYCGFDFRNPISQQFFAEWKEAMLNGIFKGNWQESRHDMTAGSIIANKQGLLPLYSKGGTFFAYIGPTFGIPKGSVVAHLQGM